MQSIENGMVVGLGRHYARQDHTDDLCVAAYEALRIEMLDALTTEPTQIVQTPAWGSAGKTAAAFSVIEDEFAGKSGEASLIEVLRIVGGVARGEDMQLRASAWIAARANEHADYHRDDLVELLEGD